MGEEGPGQGPLPGNEIKFDNHNLVITGATGSGKSIASCFLAMATDDPYMPESRKGMLKIVCIQNRRAPQEMRAGFAQKILPPSWFEWDQRDGRDRKPIKVFARTRIHGKLEGLTLGKMNRCLVFTTSGTFVNVARHHQFMPDFIILDEIHERTSSNDFAIHGVVACNIARLENS